MNTSKSPTGIEVRNDSIRIVFSYKGQRCRPTLKGLKSTPRNIKFAERKRNTVLYEINQGSFSYAAHFPDCPKSKLFSPDAKGVIIESAVIEWLARKEKTTAPSTFSNYRSKTNCHIIPKWGSRNVLSILPSEIEDWILNDLARLANKTINELLIILRGVLGDYSRDFKSFDNPIKGIENRVVLHDEPDPFTQNEIARIVSTPTLRIQEVNMIELAIWSGLSLSEYIALAWEDIDLEKGEIKVTRARVEGKWKTPKEDKRTRTVELLDSAICALQRQRAHTYLMPQMEIEVLQKDNKTIKKQMITPVFLNTNTGRPHVSDMPVRDRFFKGHLKKAKVRYRGPNHCRHTYCSQMLTIGMPKEWIANQLGHTSTSMIDKHYGTWIREDATGMAAIASKRLNMPHLSPIGSRDIAK
jgi:integrase